jgi:hypothetical protein
VINVEKRFMKRVSDKYSQDKRKDDDVFVGVIVEEMFKSCVSQDKKRNFQ